MLILAFETSAKAGSVALMDDEKLLGERYQNTGLTHSQTLLPMAQNLIEECGFAPQDVQARQLYRCAYRCGGGKGLCLGQ